jgi:hypothetical protein
LSLVARVSIFGEKGIGWSRRTGGESVVPDGLGLRPDHSTSPADLTGSALRETHNHVRRREPATYVVRHGQETDPVHSARAPLPATASVKIPFPSPTGTGASIIVAHHSSKQKQREHRPRKPARERAKERAKPTGFQ